VSGGQCRVLHIDGPRAAIGENRSGAFPSARRLIARSAPSAGSHQLLGLAVVACLTGCEPTVVIGQWTCPASTVDAGAAGDSGAQLSVSEPTPFPWSTSFENRFCDYRPPAGFCTTPSRYRTVTSPVHSGKYAAAYTVVAEDGSEYQQSRCVRQGILPDEAYYGAWYYIPSIPTSYGLWNLFHFQGTDTPIGEPRSLWDVSLTTTSDGKLETFVLKFMWDGTGDHTIQGPPVPIGSWFHLEFYLKRAKDTTGEVALYQDGVRIADFPNVVTDNTTYGQWFAGNLATSMNPPEYTLYVDDVTISASLSP